jgi:hypothetical protein
VDFLDYATECILLRKVGGGSRWSGAGHIRVLATSPDRANRTPHDATTLACMA